MTTLKSSFYIRPGARAFTLVELLLVIVVIGVLAAILVSLVGTARNAASKAASVSNLRSLSVANMTYANERGGVYAPAYKLTEEGNINWSIPWAVNPQFTTYFGTPNPGWVSARWPEAAKSGFDVTPNPTLGPGVMTIGYNISDYFWGLNLIRNGRTSLRPLEIENPSTLIMFAEATDVNITHVRRNDWRPEHDSDEDPNGRSAIAYRANDLTIAVSYEGNVFTLSPAEAQDPKYWFAQP